MQCNVFYHLVDLLYAERIQKCLKVRTGQIPMALAKMQIFPSQTIMYLALASNIINIRMFFWCKFVNSIICFSYSNFICNKILQKGTGNQSDFFRFLYKKKPSNTVYNISNSLFEFTFYSTVQDDTRWHHIVNDFNELIAMFVTPEITKISNWSLPYGNHQISFSMFQHDPHPGFVLQHCILPPEKEKIKIQKYNARDSYWL